MGFVGVISLIGFVLGCVATDMARNNAKAIDAIEIHPSGSLCAYGDIVFGEEVVQGHDGGSYYQVVGTHGAALTWMEAYQDAKSRCYKGHQGYLAIIGTQDENDFIHDLVQDVRAWQTSWRLVMTSLTPFFLSLFLRRPRMLRVITSGSGQQTRVLEAHLHGWGQVAWARGSSCFGRTERQLMDPLPYGETASRMMVVYQVQLRTVLQCTAAAERCVNMLYCAFLFIRRPYAFTHNCVFFFQRHSGMIATAISPFLSSWLSSGHLRMTSRRFGPKSTKMTTRPAPSMTTPSEVPLLRSLF
jgi:hypothetical protein